MAKIQTYSMEKILVAQKILRNLPAKEREKSRVEVVAFLKGDLRKAVKQGHSLKDIQAILAEQGISVPLSSMEAVLGQPGKDSARKKPDSRQPSPKEKKAKSETAAVDVLKKEIVQSETRATIPVRKPEPLPSYYTPDMPDSEL